MYSFDLNNFMNYLYDEFPLTTNHFVSGLIENITVLILNNMKSATAEEFVKTLCDNIPELKEKEIWPFVTRNSD